MEQEEYSTPIGFQWKGIRVEQFALFEDALTKESKVDLSTNLEFGINDIHQQLSAFIGFEFKQKKRLIIKLAVSCHFDIELNDWNRCIVGNKIVFPKDFLLHLAIATGGTARGILFAKTENSNFSKFILPTLIIDEVLTQDVSFVLHNQR